MNIPSPSYRLHPSNRSLIPLAHPPTASTPLHPLQARIEQAEAGGCPEALVSDAKRQLHRLLLAEVKAELEAGGRDLPAGGQLDSVIAWAGAAACLMAVQNGAPALGTR